MLETTLESPLDCKETKQVNPKGNQSWIFTEKDWCWRWNSNSLATLSEELTHWKRTWCWERLKAEAEGDDRGWDSWMASPTQWTWVWVNSRSLLKPMFIESVMPSNHLILYCPLLLLPSVFPSIRVFSSESALRIRWPKYWSFSSKMYTKYKNQDWPKQLARKATT